MKIFKKTNPKLKYFLFGFGACIAVIIIVFLVAAGFQVIQDKLSDRENNPNNTNNKNEKKFIGFYKENGDFECSALEQIKYGGYNFFITTDNEVYLISTYQKYSDETNCKKIEGAKVTKIIRGSAADDDGKLYNIENNELKKSIGSDPVEKIARDYLLISPYYGGQGDSGEYFLGLKEDGKIYKVKYKSDYNYEKDTYNSKIISEELFKEIENEKILYFEKADSANNDISEMFNVIKTDKAYYTMKNINEKECQKYADVNCKYELQKNEELTKEYDNIAFYTTYLIILKNKEMYTR